MSGDAPPLELADDLRNRARRSGLAGTLGGLFGAVAPFPLPAMESLWLVLLGALGVVASPYVASRPNTMIPEFFLFRQDLAVLLALTAAFRIARLASPHLSDSAAVRLSGLAERRGGALCLAFATIVAVIGFLGWFWPYHAYPLSLDEFWASFDTEIFRRGRVLAEIPREWRGFASALQPQWRLEIPGDVAWSSTYLPMNAAFRALFARLGSPALAGPFWAGLSVVMVYRIARDLWPERRDAALVAALLLATSSQLIVAAMTPYAMAAHLGLNLVWLWLYLRKGWWAVPLALAAGFAATGLHQVIFHPLFAAPFVAQLWLNRRWGRAAVFTAGYAAISLFWIAYWSLMLKAHGIGAGAAGTLAGSNFAGRVIGLVAQLKPAALGLMAENLLRFVAWQNPLAVVLGLAAVPAAVKAWRTPLAALVAGLLATVAIVGVVLPYQGHGWGYRYLHGYLGSLCLLAAFAWTRLVDASAEIRRRAWSAAAVCAGLALLVALPMRLLQVDAMIAPYAAAFRTIRAADADVVLLDPRNMVFGIDLIRNDPFLRDAPEILDLENLDAAQIRTLCARYRVALFDAESAPMLVENAPARAVGADDARVTAVPGCLRHVNPLRSPAPNRF